MPHVVRLLALDLDDTLLRSDLTLSAENIEACKKAEENGVAIVLASGRNIHSMRKYAEELKIIKPGNYLICSNGAEILELPSYHPIFYKVLQKGLCLEIAAAIRSMDHPFQVYTDGKIFASERNSWTELDSKLTDQPIEIIGNETELFERGQMKFVVSSHPENIPDLFMNLSKKFLGRVSIVISKPYFLEILPADVDKGTALEWLSTRISVPREEVMAIGDSHNDLKMVSWAGIGCAMANALPEVRKAARFVSKKTHEDDGVAELIKSIIYPTKSMVATRPTP